MNPDDRICYCYDVSLRKLLNFARRELPQRASRMSECLGAGTGCGWCIPFLIKIAQNPDAFELDDMTPEEYASKRMTYRSTEQPKNRFDDDTSCGSVQSPAAEDGPDQCQAEDAGDQIADEGEVLDADV
jgi:bacterioferritin-associated ferredoxin